MDSLEVLTILHKHEGLVFSQIDKLLPADISGNRMQLFNCLFGLARVGLVTIDGNEQNEDSAKQLFYSYKDRRDFESLNFSVSHQYMKIADSLRFEFKHGGVNEREKSAITCHPQFGIPLHLHKRADLFVIMPFKKEMDNVYENYLTPIAKISNMTIMRADDIYSNRPIMQDVWAGIFASRIVIADCTGRNPNVFYEMGIAHTLGKPVIIITQNSDDVPTDVRHIKYIKYSPENLDLVDLYEALASALHDNFYININKNSSSIYGN
jgi:hypothetical protein